MVDTAVWGRGFSQQRFPVSSRYCEMEITSSFIWFVQLLVRDMPKSFKLEPTAVQLSAQQLWDGGGGKYHHMTCQLQTCSTSCPLGVFGSVLWEVLVV